MNKHEFWGSLLKKYDKLPKLRKHYDGVDDDWLGGEIIYFQSKLWLQKDDNRNSRFIRLVDEFK